MWYVLQFADYANSPKVSTNPYKYKTLCVNMTQTFKFDIYYERMFTEYRNKILAVEYHHWCFLF